MKTKNIRKILAVAFLLSLNACAGSNFNKVNEQSFNQQFSETGSITISRVISDPIKSDSAKNDSAKNTGQDENKELRLGFLSASPSLLENEAVNQTYIFIDKTEKNLSIHKMLNDNFVSNFSTKIKQMNDIPSGVYKIIHRQTNPEWYADDKYFIKRGLPVPSKWNQIRYRKGALGNKSLFLKDSLAIHDSVIFSEEVGGIQLDSEAMNNLFIDTINECSVIIK